MVVDLGSFKYIFNKVGPDHGGLEVQQQDVNKLWTIEA